MKHYLLYNPLAGCGHVKEDTDILDLLYDNTVLVDMTTITDYAAFFAGLDEDDIIVLCGGDGTLHRFVNDTRHLSLRQNLYFYSIGTGNDFVRDLGKPQGATPTFSLRKYLEHLPSVTVNGENHLFINNVGFGIDGYCTEEGDLLKKRTGKPVNYTKVAIKGLLRHYHPTNATVTVDGKKYTYRHVWFAPTMNGRFYGGGMMCAPDQNRLDPHHPLTLVLMHTAGRLRTLLLFPSIFKGKHVKNKRLVAVHTGQDITVEFDRPTPLQIDGETIPNVTRYHAVSAALSSQQ